jgi:hypothetical protein
MLNPEDTPLNLTYAMSVLAFPDFRNNYSCLLRFTFSTATGKGCGQNKRVVTA